MENEERRVLRKVLEDLSVELIKLDEFQLSVYEFAQILDLTVREFTELERVDNQAYVIGKNNCPLYLHTTEYRAEMEKCETVLKTETSGSLYECCKLGQQISNMHEKALRFMKYNTQPPHAYQTSDEYIRDYGKGAQVNYFNSERQLEDPEIYVATTNPRILTCDNGHNSGLFADRCNLFKRSITNNGIGYTFNAISFEEYFNKLPYLEMMKEVLNVDTEADNTPVIYEPEGNSQQSYVRLSLQLSDFYDGFNRVPAELITPIRDISNEFRITLHDPKAAPDLRSDFVGLKAGYAYKILVTPTHLTGGGKLRTLSFKDRNCRYPDENDQLYFHKTYSKSACTMECHVRLAYDTCGCVPWSYPHFQNEDQSYSRLCDTSGHNCFEKVMRDPPTAPECGCLSNCDNHIYAYSITAKPLLVKDYCDPGEISVY